MRDLAASSARLVELIDERQAERGPAPPPSDACLALLVEAEAAVHNDPELARLRAERAAREEQEQSAYERGSKALMLAPSLAIYRALMRGEAVPLAALDQEAVRRLGWRPRRKEA